MAEGSPYRIMISGGGTGGHIYPAIAIANTLKTLEKNIEIIFVGAQGKMEMEKVPEAGYKIIGLWISGIQRSLTLDNLSFPFKLISSVLRSFKLLNEFKPDAVVGVGGYASGPLLYAATKKGIPTLIQEQNSYAGITNKLLAGNVDKVCVASDGMDKFFPKDKIILTGNPVRTDILNVDSKKEEALKFFGFSKDKEVLLILGGSLGARTLNEAMITNLDKLITSGIQVIWQTGKFYYDEMVSRTEGKDISNFRVLAFLKEMDLTYAASDVVISRAGALSISELCLTGRPVIFVPSPNVAEDHQTKNAEALVSKEAAIMVKDINAKEDLIDIAIKLIADKNQRAELSKNIKKMGRPEAANDIAKEILSLIK
ncbi:MAG: UDP-N-acetylglucosamine--N-acetylmuramyl-(pentapeptide) pyrophosphoryl-undecaprenol N-acetylglucosamine transferase [Cyclobacteriaceae bacterium]|jgi:UDP-N-acetylglucosamine--N-acetylmuramyl-(pentapeptide) pyrophosphoryl-undecaprenol N-acetylglucosamine transferase